MGMIVKILEQNNKIIKNYYLKKYKKIAKLSLK